MKRFLLKNLKIIIHNAKMSFEVLSTYRAATLLKLFINAFMILIYIFLWKALYGENSVVNGYGLNELLLFIILLRMLRTIYPFHISSMYGYMIKDGSIVSWLLKPTYVEIRLLSQAIGQAAYNSLFCCIPSLALVFIFVHIPPIPVTSYLILFLWIISAFVFAFMLEINIGVMSYYTVSIWGINNFKATIIAFLAGELLPLSFYPLRLYKILELFPFASIYYIPISVFVGEYNGSLWMPLYILWFSIVLFLGAYLILSKKMIKKIMVQGG